MECPRKNKLERGSDLIEEGSVHPQDSRDVWNCSAVPGQTIGNPLVASELHSISNLGCRSAVGGLASTEQKGFRAGGPCWGLEEACRGILCWVCDPLQSRQLGLTQNVQTGGCKILERWCSGPLAGAGSTGCSHTYHCTPSLRREHLLSVMSLSCPLLRKLGSSPSRRNDYRNTHGWVSIEGCIWTERINNCLTFIIFLWLSCDMGESSLYLRIRQSVLPYLRCLQILLNTFVIWCYVFCFPELSFSCL